MTSDAKPEANAPDPLGDLSRFDGHTRGPLRVDRTVALGAYGVWTDYPTHPGHDGQGYESQVCSMKPLESTVPREQRDANAELIAAAPLLLAEVKRLRAERDRMRRVLTTCKFTLETVWRDLHGWHQFARYNAEGILCGETIGLPDPPQRPTVAGANITDQNIVVVEEVLGFIADVLKDAGVATGDHQP